MPRVENATPRTRTAFPRHLRQGQGATVQPEIFTPPALRRETRPNDTTFKEDSLPHTKKHNVPRYLERCSALMPSSTRSCSDSISSTTAAAASSSSQSGRPDDPPPAIPSAPPRPVTGGGRNNAGANDSAASRTVTTRPPPPPPTLPASPGSVSSTAVTPLMSERDKATSPWSLEDGGGASAAKRSTSARSKGLCAHGRSSTRSLTLRTRASRSGIVWL